jgi:hypothetical protein
MKLPHGNIIANRGLNQVDIPAREFVPPSRLWQNQKFPIGNPRGIALELPSTKESELLKECLAELIADRWLTQCHSSNLYKLTEEGYQHFEPRLRALRVLR